METESPCPNHYAKMQLLLHEKLHNDLCRVSYRSSGAEDGGNAGFVEEVVVLRGDDTLLGGGRSSRFNGTTLRGEECNNAKKNATLTL